MMMTVMMVLGRRIWTKIISKHNLIQLSTVSQFTWVYLMSGFLRGSILVSFSKLVYNQWYLLRGGPVKCSRVYYGLGGLGAARQHDTGQNRSDCASHLFVRESQCVHRFYSALLWVGQNWKWMFRIFNCLCHFDIYFVHLFPKLLEKMGWPPEVVVKPVTGCEFGKDP